MVQGDSVHSSPGLRIHQNGKGKREREKEKNKTRKGEERGKKTKQRGKTDGERTRKMLPPNSETMTAISLNLKELHEKLKLFKDELEELLKGTANRRR